MFRFTGLNVAPRRDPVERDTNAVVFLGAQPFLVDALLQCGAHLERATPPRSRPDLVLGIDRSRGN